MSDLFFALSRQGCGMADKNRRIPVNRAALPMDGKNLPRARLWDKPKTVIRKLSSNVECGSFANLRTSAVICLCVRLRRSPLRIQPGAKLSARHKHAI